MGTETRIGILTGLVIVVIASVYFFYGSDSPNEDFLIVTENQVSQPPTIPLSSEQKASSPNTGGEADASRRVADRANRRSASPAADAPTGHSRQRKVAPRRLADASQTRDEREVTTPSRLTTPTAREASPHTPNDTGATPLRTGPSQDLIDATKRNVEDEQQENAAGDQTAMGDTGASRRSDIARIVERLRKNRAAESPTASDSTQSPATPNRSEQTPARRATPRTGDAADRPTGDTSVAPSSRTTRQAAAQRRHKIVRNDTLEGIALRYYNDRARVDDILRANPGIDPRRLKIGDEIILPADQQRPATESSTVANRGEQDNQPTAARPRVEAPVATRTYTVREDESFYSIARAQLGNGSRWQELFDLNRDVVKNNPRGLKPGMVLRLPN